MKKRYMTKRAAVALFREYFADAFKNDSIARRCAWNDFTDSLMKNGDISEKQYDSWTNPF
ncbi:hypothetical protein UFOVP453_39 [uncultured Caudovirales phage]|uniref:Uncharacterized protein n=1 Tax=uncultured Caudovirales phage TaxID=2100421 RepID=A0A6J5ME88_9CAUD|nr:hypothetical protein UFOVP453_39 [uncultured Caudovirales phage]